LTSHSTAPISSTKQGWLVKGGDRAQTRERIVAAAAHRFVVPPISSNKLVEGVHPPIPIEILAFASETTLRLLGDARTASDERPAINLRPRHQAAPKRTLVIDAALQYRVFDLKAP
jgi:ribose 5-phosphate isomerase